MLYTVVIQGSQGFRLPLYAMLSFISTHKDKWTFLTHRDQPTYLRRQPELLDFVADQRLHVFLHIHIIQCALNRTRTTRDHASKRCAFQLYSQKLEYGGLAKKLLFISRGYIRGSIFHQNCAPRLSYLSWQPFVLRKTTMEKVENVH